MTEQDKHQQRDYSKFDTMSTETLEEILQLDAMLPENEAIDPDAILYILEVLARREKENGTAPDVEAALRQFNKKYRPYVSDATSLYDLGDDLISDEERNNLKNTPAAVTARPRRRLNRAGFRVGFAAMIAVVILAAGTVTASAFGYDIWGSLVKWTGEVFGFQSSAEQSQSVAQQLNALQIIMEKEGVVAEDVLPSYLPEGYEVISTQSWPGEAYIKFDCLLSNGESSIIFNYFLHRNGSYTNEFEKNLTNPELYKVGGITHYLMDNVDTYFVAWSNGHVECSIAGMRAKEEIIKVIDSIYGE